MKKYNAVYYLLFILLVMGAFAAMAQNNYGLKIMGGVAFVFGLVFMVEFIFVLREKDKNEVFELIEPLCLFIISVIFGLRVFYIRFPFVEWLFVAAAILLLLFYLRKMMLHYQHFRQKSNLLAIVLLVYYLSLVLFLFSLILVPFIPEIAEVIGVGAFVLLLCFIGICFFSSDLLVDGENVTAFKTVADLKDHSIIIGTLFMLFSLYTGFNKMGGLPGIYSDEFPKAYFELVEKATAGKEKRVEGSYKYEAFREQYKVFLTHQKKPD